MDDIIGAPSLDVGTGSSLLLKQSLAIADGDTWLSDPIDTRSIGSLGIDIVTDHACTVEVVRIPDVTDTQKAGASSDPGNVTAGTAAFFTYSAVMTPYAKIKIVNSAGAALTGSLFVRGGA